MISMGPLVEKGLTTMSILTIEVGVGDILRSKAKKEEINDVLDIIVLVMEVAGTAPKEVSLMQV